MPREKVADEVDLTERLRHSRELIAALDRRVPRVERVGEVSSARDAAATLFVRNTGGLGRTEQPRTTT